MTWHLNSVIHQHFTEELDLSKWIWKPTSEENQKNLVLNIKRLYVKSIFTSCTYPFYWSINFFQNDFFLRVWKTKPFPQHSLINVLSEHRSTERVVSLGSHRDRSNLENQSVFFNCWISCSKEKRKYVFDSKSSAHSKEKLLKNKY